MTGGRIRFSTKLVKLIFGRISRIESRFFEISIEKRRKRKFVAEMTVSGTFEVYLSQGRFLSFWRSAVYVANSDTVILAVHC
jgi:hypothetical protein